MYKYRKARKSKLKSVELVEGETIEQKIERIVSNKEPITDGAPEIYTERKQGVLSAYNIRTDRWDVAADGMDMVQKNIQAKRDGKANKKASGDSEGKKGKVVDMKGGEVGGAESTEAKAK
tara:strand:- start:799 stop:1158 length:360 start_codon:yes stop_codon:yes gene_type:complete